jgi:predicted lipoprotein with Yx(FWY)xxD motif
VIEFRLAEGIMRRIFLLFAFTAAFMLAGGAVLADHHAVKVAEKEGVGRFLTDAKGMTLYVFKMDSPGKSACEGGCLEKWPIYHREKVAPPPGIDAERFGTITRADGKPQSTYKGMPLYYFAGDKAKGDTAGQGLRDAWFVAAP